MNLIVLFLEIIIATLSLIYMYQKYKNEGIYLFIVVSVIILSIMSTKLIELFNFDVNLDLVLNSLLFISTTILVHKKGPEEVKKIITIILITSLMLFTTSIIVTLITNSKINNVSNISFNHIFDFRTRTYLAFIISLIISLWINSSIYHQIRQIKNKIWISNTLSIIISSFIECILFVLIAYLFQVHILTIIKLILTRYIVKVVLCISGTKLIYLLNDINNH